MPKNDAPDKALVEAAAQAIYEHWAFDDRAPNPKPSWVPNGNSEKQDVARRLARAALSALSQHGGLVEAALRHIADADPGAESDQSLAHEMANVARQALTSSDSPVVGEDDDELERAEQLASWREAKRRVRDATLPLIHPTPTDTADHA